MFALTGGNMAIEKAKEIEQAKKRRAKLLDDYEKLGITQFKFSKKCGLSPQRLSQLLAKAREEHALSHKELA